jgi:hypothetical protein
MFGGTHATRVLTHVRCVRPQYRKYMIRVGDETRQLVKDCLVSFIARVACLPLINIEYRMELTNKGTLCASSRSSFPLTS